jgi:hypothetical protein
MFGVTHVILVRVILGNWHDPLRNNFYRAEYVPRVDEGVCAKWITLSSHSIGLLRQLSPLAAEFLIVGLNVNVANRRGT